MTIEVPFIVGILILLAIFMVITRVHVIVADKIGEKIRMFFIVLWKMIKR